MPLSATSLSTAPFPLSATPLPTAPISLSSAPIPHVPTSALTSLYFLPPISSSYLFRCSSLSPQPFASTLSRIPRSRPWILRRCLFLTVCFPTSAACGARVRCSETFKSQ
eukprot:2585942-Rhodomonas_salina.2